jgi:hypothetical protein
MSVGFILKPMYTIKIKLLTIPISACILSCYSTPKKVITNKTEVIDHRFKQFEPNAKDTSTPFWDILERVWYQDNMAIEEVRVINMVTDSKDNTVTDYPIKCYRFSDLRGNAAYEYSSFNDTAKLIRKFSYNDTSIRVAGGWGFKHNRIFKNIGQLEKLTDTVINKMKFSRITNKYVFYEVTYSMTYLMRCDKKGSAFSLVTSMKEADGCPIVNLYQQPHGDIGLHFSSEIRFISDTFNTTEQSVFDTWKKYAKENPIK